MSQEKTKAEIVYEYIQTSWQEKQSIPTQREIAKACHISLSRLADTLSQLEAQGRIVRQRYKSRGIRLVDNEQKENESAEEVYRFLQETVPTGDIPSQGEIGEACLLSRSGVRLALIWLEAQGRIEIGSGQREIRLI